LSSCCFDQRVKPVSGFKTEVRTDGPGKLCREFKIDKILNGTPAFGPEAKLWLEDRGEKIKLNQIKKSPRIGVDYAKEYKNKPWRFYL
jgi:DNA-3-methyladenine glycosylase